MSIPMDEVGNTVDKLALMCIEMLRGYPHIYTRVAKELGCTVEDLEALYQLVKTT
jgi:hypothetical protein